MSILLSAAQQRAALLRDAVDLDAIHQRLDYARYFVGIACQKPEHACAAEGESLRRRNTTYPLIPEMAMPPMMCFCPNRNTSTQGSTTMAEAAMIRFHLEE